MIVHKTGRGDKFTSICGLSVNFRKRNGAYHWTKVTCMNCERLGLGRIRGEFW